MSCLEFYTMREWNFVIRNPVQLKDKMSNEEQSRPTFNFNVRKMECETYIRRLCSWSAQIPNQRWLEYSTGSKRRPELEQVCILSSCTRRIEKINLIFLVQDETYEKINPLCFGGTLFSSTLFCVNSLRLTLRGGGFYSKTTQQIPPTLLKLLQKMKPIILSRESGLKLCLQWHYQSGT